MYILGIHTGHDASACLFKDGQLIAFCKEERLTRVKNDGGFFELGSIQEVFRVGGISSREVDVVCATRMNFPAQAFKGMAIRLARLPDKLLKRRRDVNLSTQMIKYDVEETQLLDLNVIKNKLQLRTDCKVSFINHHLSHVLGAWYFTDWAGDNLYVSCDGGGDGAHYSAYVGGEAFPKVLIGKDETLRKEPQNGAASVGLAYAFATELCGFIPNRHEGKLTGLAAFGEPIFADRLQSLWTVTDDGHVLSQLKGAGALKRFMHELFADASREDIAATIQYVTENVVLNWITKLRHLHPVSRIAMSGGVFSNVRLNQKVAELPDVEEIFVFPAMGDEGLSVGACVSWWCAHNNNVVDRRRLGQPYYGFPWSGSDLIKRAVDDGFPVERMEDPSNSAAGLLKNGQVGAIFYSGMEMGPRALGARSILASPADRSVNDSINKRLQRTEFMPFAPVVRDIDAKDVFAINSTNKYACHFMTITTDVNAKWRDRIPAVVHVDGTARPQIISREYNPLYYDIVSKFKELTGLPCLVNTSFNVHEEPIINTPEEALRALKDNRVDFLVCESGLIFPLA